MTKEEFKEKVQFLHIVCGVPYSEIGKRLNVTGQYISLMMNDRKPITENVLNNATKCDMFNYKLVGGGENECSKLEPYNN